MNQTDIDRLHAEHWRTGYGSVAPDELTFFQQKIVEHRPKKFIEIGTASGLSGGFIAQFMDENGGEKFTTVDHDNTFFGDPTKPNGFLLREIYTGSGVVIEDHTFKVAPDIPSFLDNYEMAFVDANHQHPWPLLDTLCVYPFLTGPKLVFEHDLDLYRKQDEIVWGIGPKYLYDQFPDTHRERAEANNGNLFCLSFDLPKEKVEQIAIDALNLPWSMRTPIPRPSLEKIRAFLAEYYSPAVLEAFDKRAQLWNRPLAGYVQPTPPAAASAAASAAATAPNAAKKPTVASPEASTSDAAKTLGRAAVARVSGMLPGSMKAKVPSSVKDRIRSALR